VINIDGFAYQVFDLPDDGLNLGAGPFTPDSTRIAFEGFHPTDPAAEGIYIGSATDGGGLSRVTDQHDIPGDFSPDGSRLAFHRPTPNIDASPLSGTVMIVDLDGLAVHQVTPNGMVVQCCPQWSPDGSRILFGDPAGSLWLINPDGSNLSEIFAGGADNGYAISAAWSPDGSHIVFALDSGPDPFAHPTNEVIVINADGTGATTVIATKDHKRNISWLPTSGD
jgi:Tol biopolymer transport system component